MLIRNLSFSVKSVLQSIQTMYIYIYSVIKPGAYIMTKAFFGGLIHGGAYIRGGLYTEGKLH